MRAGGTTESPAAAHASSLREINELLRARQEEPTRSEVADLLLGRTKRPPKPRLGRYELERELGHGAMGTVYLGRDPRINRVVAVKAIPLAQEFEGAALQEARGRFFREAEMAGRLKHPSIVTVYDAGEDGGIAYIAMEYVRGRLLSEHSTSDELLPAAHVLEIVARIADALDYAHAQEIVHRDIKPSNVIFDPATLDTKITDFGIARLTNSTATRTGIVLGTPSFMSPEQLEGRTVNGRSDLFSLGVTLFQLLAGQLPFRADSMTGLMDKIANAPHPPLRTIRPDLPPCVGLIVDRALQKDPARRFVTGAEMARALRACARSLAA
jgi:serine/threonine-protein kinase